MEQAREITGGILSKFSELIISQVSNVIINLKSIFTS